MKVAHFDSFQFHWNGKHFYLLAMHCFALVVSAGGQIENVVNLVYLFSSWVGFVWLFNIQQLCRSKLFALVCALSQLHKILINIVCIFCNWNSSYCCCSSAAFAYFRVSLFLGFSESRYVVFNYDNILVVLKLNYKRDLIIQWSGERNDFINLL